MSEFRQRDTSTHEANATDFDIEIVRISFCIWNSPPNSSHVSMYLSIWHDGSTELDSLFLRFSTQSYFASLYLKASDCVWPEASFRQDNLDAILAVNDLGSYGAGTATLEFILIANEHTENLALTIDFSLHYAKPLPLTSLKGHTFLEVPIPA